MSSRALRKLQGKTHQEIDPLSVVSHDSEEDSDSTKNDESTNRKSKKNKHKKNVPLNPFELLEAEDNDQEVLNEEETLQAEQPENQADTRKKKKKKKKKQKEKTNKVVDEDFEASLKLAEGADNADVNGDIPASTPITQNMRALLFVEHKNLNPDNEMRRIFGSRVVQGENSRRQRQQRGRTRQRVSWLTTPRDNWPPMGKTGLTMSFLETRGGCQYFTFEHSQSYQDVEFQFYDAVESLNPQNIANIIQLHPYHVAALLQLSEVFHMGEDAQASAELIERALLSCELSFHPLFSLTTGTTRLDFKRSENRPFFLTLFKHLAIVGQKGCYKTALEFCKLLLSLEPEMDPMCVLLMIDFYALRAQEYSFIVRLYQEWEAHRNLTQLPNFAFSVPLAMYLLAINQEEDSSKADTMLQESLLMFPGMLQPLLDKCNINPDPQVSSHAFFGPDSQYSQPPALKQLIGLYIGRCYSCWKQPEVLEWLERNVKVVLQRVDNKDSMVEQCRIKRLSRYQGTPRNILRHILISEIKDATAALPPDIANTTVLSYDPLPPLDSVCGYNRPERPRAVEDAGALSTFFRSLLPNFNVDEPAAAAGAAGGQHGNDLRQGIGVLMDAMRDLLNNIRPVDVPRDNQGDNPENDGNDDIEPGEWD
ncbi:transcription factor 25-like [Mizuhopecten yessoensis]|uniref:Transcription factor 25 n=1 Tax=Mizuhopecten yessoensis TaxID=6573 RepID=A0A210PGK9_MIZYE|nr:transcription factor 25-like [Mizuhopecten yessoensis]OWF35632.1 Transcription factor 25 [Mizuhopecten yessoensis]